MLFKSQAKLQIVSLSHRTAGNALRPSDVLLVNEREDSLCASGDSHLSLRRRELINIHLFQGFSRGLQGPPRRRGLREQLIG